MNIIRLFKLPQYSSTTMEVAKRTTLPTFSFKEKKWYDAESPPHNVRFIFLEFWN